MKKKDSYSVASNLAFILRCMREDDPNLLIWMALHVIFTAIGNIVPVLIPKMVIDQIAQHGSITNVLLLSIVFGVAMFVSNSFTSTANGTISTRMISLRLRFIARSGEKFMTMDYQNLEQPEVLDLSERGERAHESNDTGVEGVMRIILSSSGYILTLFGIITVLSIVGPELLIPIFILLTINYLVSNNGRKKQKKEHDLQAPIQRKLWYFENMTIYNIFGKDVRLFGMKKFLLERYKEEQDNNFRIQKRIGKIWLKINSARALTSLVQEIILYAWLCWRVISKAISIGNFVMYLTSIRAFSAAANGLLEDYANLQEQSAVICDYRSFLDLPDGPSGDQMLSNAIHADGGTIKFENVSFKYPGSDSYALKDINLTISMHEKLAVVGLNGAGKTTFVKLLMRLYRPTSGHIYLNGIDIQSYDRDEYYKLFSALFQDINVLAFTVTENVSMNEYKNTNIERVENALKLAGLTEKIDTLKKRIDTRMLKVIEEDGVEFSGGENQKLAFARALYKDAPFIVLDEPTAALDALAEEQLYREFDRITKNKTAIYISHRLASTRFCDRIILFEKGEITECGTHDELIKQNGKYSKLFNIQAQYYRQEAEVAL